ncbi:MAG: hypothetical protein AAF528_04835 [Cyanobacteria bacterium P01_C01_bin.121]
MSLCRPWRLISARVSASGGSPTGLSLVSWLRCGSRLCPLRFAAKWSAVVGYSVVVRCPSSGPGRFAVSVPCVVPSGVVRLQGGQRGGRARVRFVR